MAPERVNLPSPVLVRPTVPAPLAITPAKVPSVRPAVRFAWLRLTVSVEVVPTRLLFTVAALPPFSRPMRVWLKPARSKVDAAAPPTLSTMPAGIPSERPRTAVLVRFRRVPVALPPPA